MNKIVPFCLAVALGGSLALTWSSARAETGEFDELLVLIEINATDGDVGFHVKHDTDGWQNVTITDPNGDLIFNEDALMALAGQGLTENFFESAEPPCWFEADNEDVDWEADEVVTLAEFLGRFPAGLYSFMGTTIEGDGLAGMSELTYNIPAAPRIRDIENARPGWTRLRWRAGNDLGECDFEDTGIPDPETVEVVAWEVVVEPDDDDYDEPFKRIFSAQLPASQRSIRIPAQYLQSFADDVTEFKYEVGAIEVSGNRTFSEAALELRERDDDSSSDE